MKTTILILLFHLVAVSALAAEESLDLEKETAPPAASVQVGAPSSGPRLMGRVDLTYEVSPWENPGQIEKNDSFKNYHFLIFLKAQPSKQVEFMGEIIARTFFEIRYTPSSLLALKFGKIVVPFGDTTRYHHFYGGIQGFGAGGVLFPLIWAEPGVDAEWRLGFAQLDTYLVNGIAAATGDPDFKGASDSATQALGMRATVEVLPKIKMIGSAYFDHWQPGKALLILGGDWVSAYRLVDEPVLRNLRLSAGVANGWVQQGVLGGFRKYGDYLELATNAVGFCEPRIRYGTYIDNSANRSGKDTQALDLSANFPINALNLLAEYQFNWEAFNEKANDLVRIMVSLDF